ncbi:MAG: ABC transporter substrate-binding protein [Chloroflexi bacterium]|nr:ABC transporter substrate-binding protein [Chloroflexota bacterium]
MDETRPLALKTAMGTYGHTRALKEGAVSSPRLSLQFVEVDPITEAFARMVRALEYDVSEMALVTYLLARTYGRPITALPLVLVRSFHHGAVSCNAGSEIKTPKDLEGKRIGIRSYGQTTGVWVRGILQHEYGVDLDTVTWVLTEEEHVPEFRPAARILRHPHRTRNLEQMLVSGEIDAAIGLRAAGNPAMRPLFPDAEATESAWFRQTGIYPVNHVVAIKDSVLAAHPWVALELSTLLQAAKDAYLARLEARGPTTDEDRQRLHQRALLGGDPLPYGLEANRKGVEALIQYAVEQGVIPQRYPLAELFTEGAPSLS